MKFLIVLAAAFATVAIASPADATAPANDLLTNNPVAHKANQNGPAPAGCYWAGVAPFCVGWCDSDYTEIDRGSCGDSRCCLTGDKALCCK